MLYKIADWIMPITCFYCGKIGYAICKKCLAKINIKSFFQKIEKEEYDYVFCGSYYKGVIRTRIHSFKFHRKPYLRKYFIELSLKDEKICEFLKEFDYITYVPMHCKKEQERGYNQAKLLAEFLGTKLHKKVIKTLEKAKENKMQSSLSKAERAQNVKDVFQYKCKKGLKSKKIILVDDIFTTGATVRACSKILKEHSVEEICVFTIAKA